jgi:predicted NBD/HSP70 family sugar kinase
MRGSNASAVLQAVLTAGPVARADLARLTGLSPVSVTRQVSSLMGARLLRELPPVGSDLGRPRVPVDLDLEAHSVLGVHIGLLRTSLGLVDIRGHPLTSRDLPHTSREPVAILEQAAIAIPEFLARHARETPPLGIGLAVGGWVDPERGEVIEHDALGWRRVPVRAFLAEWLAHSVWVDSNVRAMALAEVWFGRGSGAESLIHVFVGSVVGAGIVLRRNVHRGAQAAAGALAHLPLSDRSVMCACGRQGCFQALASDVALLERTGAASIGELVEAARAGDSGVDDLLRRRARHIGEAVGILIDLFNPDLVVLGGSGTLTAPEYVPEIRAEAARRAHLGFDPESTIVPTAFGEAELVVAPAALILEALYQRPLELVSPSV